MGLFPLLNSLESYTAPQIPGLPPGNCSSAVLWCAHAISDPDKLQTPLSLVPDLTPPAMIRALANRRLDFPVFMVVHEWCTVDHVALVRAHRSRRERPDNWAIVYIPAHPGLGLQPHWTFARTTGAARRSAVSPYPVWLISTAPCRPDQNDWWQAQVTPANLPEVLAAEAAGRACRCHAASEPCPHMARWVSNHPTGKIVSLIPNTQYDYAARAAITSVSTLPDIVVLRGPNRTAHITTPNGNTHIIPEAYDNSFLVHPAPLRDRLADLVLGTNRSISEGPVRQTDVAIPPYVLRVSEYAPPPRSLHGVLCFANFLSGVVCAVASYFSYLEIPGEKHGADVTSILVSTGQGGSERLSRVIYDKALEICGRGPSLLTRVTRTVTAMAKRAFVYRKVGLFAGVGIGSFALSYYAWRAYRLRAVGFVTSVGPAYEFGHIDDIDTDIPGLDTIAEKLSSSGRLPTMSELVDILKRQRHDDRWVGRLHHIQMALIAERFRVAPPGLTRFSEPEPGKCLNCLSNKMKYRGECKTCITNRRIAHIPVTPSIHSVSYIGVVGLWSVPYTLPDFEFSDTMELFQVRNGRRVRTKAELMALLESHPEHYTCRGRNAGPSFMSIVPVCFPKGVRGTVSAFAVRLGSKRPKQAQKWAYDVLWAFYLTLSRPPIEPEDDELFLSHFQGPKLRNMLEARRRYWEGEEPLTTKRGLTTVVCDGLLKAEKSFNVTYTQEGLKEKPTTKPRFISSPPAVFLYMMGRYTHAQTKWLGTMFPWNHVMFYAGCATPEELNANLQETLLRIPEPVRICEDVTATDANHSRESFDFHALVRQDQFPFLDEETKKGFDAEEDFFILLSGIFLAHVKYVNGSGFPDTSYKNSLLCVFIRLFALVHVFCDLRHSSLEEILEWASRVLQYVMMAGSGDDGLTSTPSVMFGVDMLSDWVKVRYIQAWAFFGFDIKVKFYAPYEWRLGTFLAMRPTHTEAGYVWTPEPARRLRSLFWMIDKDHHPLTWALAVVKSLYASGSPNPILFPICQWYILRVNAPEMELGIDDLSPYSTWHKFSYKTAPTKRAMQEAMNDYGYTEADYTHFLQMLDSTSNVFVDLRCQLLHRVFLSEE